MPNFTQEYRSTDVGMLPVNGLAGSLIAVLDAVLVNGGTPMPVTSMAQSGTTVTALIPSDVSLENKDWLVIAGASPAGANGAVQILAIDGTHFSYEAAAGLGVITGSITYRRAPLGWTKFGGTNVAAYQCASVPGCPQFWFRVDETGATAGGQKECAVRAYEAMTDVNTGTSPFPAVGQAASGVCWRKALTTDATARPWSIIGDGATFYLVINSDASFTVGRGLYGFGAFTSYKVGDAFNAFLSGWATFNITTVSGVGNNGIGFVNYMTGSGGANGGLYLARAMTQIGGSIWGTHFFKHLNSGVGAAVVGGSAGMFSYPTPVDGSLWVDTTLLLDSAASPRGKPRGMYTHCHNVNPFGNDYDVAVNVAGLPGVTLFNLLHAAGNSQGSAQFDRYGPW